MTTALFNYRKPGYRQFVESEAFKAQANGNQYQIKINSIFKKYASQLKGLIGKSGNPYEGEDDGSYPGRMKQIFAAVEQIPEAMKDFDQIAKEREQLFAKTVYQVKKVKSARGMKPPYQKKVFFVTIIFLVYKIGKMIVKLLQNIIVKLKILQKK